MADISKITLPSGTTYNIKDEVARQTLSGAIKIKGATTTALTDESTTNPIKINNKDYTAVANDAVFYNKKEYVFDGTKWHEFGDMSGLGALAYKDTASGSTTVAVPKTYTTTFTGKNKTVSVSGTTTGSVNVTKSAVTISKAETGNATYTPSGTNASSSVSGSCSVTASGNISVGTGTANYTPGGNVSQPTFSGDEMTSTGKFTPSGSIGLTTSNKTATVSAAASGTTTYQPGGSCSGTAVTLNTTTVNSITDVGTLPSATMPTYTVANEVLTITGGSFSAGTLPTKGSNTTVATSVKNVTDPTFSGTAVRLVTGNIAVPTSASFTGTEADVSVSGTPTGEVSKPSFSGTGVQLKFTGTSASGTISGTAAAQQFTGDGARLITDSEVATAASFVGASMTSTGSYTPEATSVTTTTATTENKTVNITVS
jgi:hypothetical protein